MPKRKPINPTLPETHRKQRKKHKSNRRRISLSLSSLEVTCSHLRSYRRTRNRLAQRAVRDRRTARIRHLEQQLAAFQHSDVDRFQESQDEIAKLRNGLYVARKKLFSLAATATKLANDIGPLLNLDCMFKEAQLRRWTC